MQTASIKRSIWGRRGVVPLKRPLISPDSSEKPFQLKSPDIYTPRGFWDKLPCESRLHQDEQERPEPRTAEEVAEVGGATNGGVSRENGRMIFTPAPNYNGPASFTYTVCDHGDPEKCDTATVNVTVRTVAEPSPRADLGVGVSSPTRVKVGDRLSYAIRITSRGPDRARDVVLTSKLPRSVKLISAPSGYKYRRGTHTVTRRLGDMADGARKTRQIVVRAEKAGRLTLRACSVSSDTSDPQGLLARSCGSLLDVRRPLAPRDNLPKVDSTTHALPSRS